MNYIPRFLICLISCAACGASGSDLAPPEDPLQYRVEYAITPSPEEGTIEVRMQVAQATELLRELRFGRSERISNIDGDGDLIDEDGVVRWLPPSRGGMLRWTVAVDHRRNGDGYDALLRGDWGLFRAEDVIPRAATRTRTGASSETWMDFDLPDGWSVVTPYARHDGKHRVDKPRRRFDQPGGWIVMGDLGVRRETIAGVPVAIAGPVGQSIRRMDILALLNWTLPEVARLLNELPPRLTIVSAGEPMWRGGLSGPESLYMHASRPLISENGTSTLLHEILHISLGLSSVPGYDWIVEGLAEYYSLETLRRSGTISRSRYRQARSALREWSGQATKLCGPVSTGPTTAYAVGVLAALDRELRKKTDGEASLDDVVRALRADAARVSLASLREAAKSVADAYPAALYVEKLPGCSTNT